MNAIKNGWERDQDNADIDTGHQHAQGGVRQSDPLVRRANGPVSPSFLEESSHPLFFLLASLNRLAHNPMKEEASHLYNDFFGREMFLGEQALLRRSLLLSSSR